MEKLLMHTRSQLLNLYAPKAGDGCVLWLPGQDDAYSSTIRDRSGQGNHGTITGATWVKNEQGFWVLSFDGDNDGVVTSVAGATSINPVTFVCWFKQSATIAADSRKGFAAVSGWYIDVRSLYEVRMVTSAGTARFRLDDFNLTSLLFQFFAFTYDNATDTFVYYRNGAMGSSTQLGTAPTGDISYSANTYFYMGNNNGLGGFFPGIVCLPHITNQVLSATEILGIYNQERYLFGV